MKRAVRNVLRFIAAGLVFFGGMEFAIEYARRRVQETDVSVGRCVIGAILVVLGLILFFASPNLAERLTDDFDE